ncbi:MAG: hypothetical protein IJ228_13510 [Succinivibrio sp.]|nr:hypothetical protein [Succinivibrio sp.]
MRSFDSRAAKQEKTDLILKAAQSAPTAVNCQPRQIHVLKSADA